MSDDIENKDDSNSSDKKKKDLFPNFDPTQDLFQAGTRAKKRGKGAIGLTENEIKKAQKKARSAHEASRILGVSYNTYKKYAKMFGIFEDLKNPAGIGISKGYGNSSGKQSTLTEILRGEHPDYEPWRLKRRLVRHGYLEEKCDNCGFCERRITDHKVPLMLDYLDGDRTNHVFDNLRLLCFNCYFLIVGNMRGPAKEWTLD